MVTDLRLEPCEALVDRLPRSEQHLALALDVARDDQWIAVTEQVQVQHGGLHALVNNAGIGSLATVEDETTERWTRWSLSTRPPSGSG